MKTLALLKGELHFLIIKTEKLLPIVQISLGAAGSVITPALLNLENVSGTLTLAGKIPCSHVLLLVTKKTLYRPIETKRYVRTQS